MITLPNNKGVRIAFKTAMHLARTKYDQVANCKDCDLATKDLYNAVATFFESQHLTLEQTAGQNHGEPVAWMYKRKGGEELGQLIEVESEELKVLRLGKCYEDGTRYLWPREDYYDWQPLYLNSTTTAKVTG